MGRLGTTHGVQVKKSMQAASSSMQWCSWAKARMHRYCCTVYLHNTDLILKVPSSKLTKIMALAVPQIYSVHDCRTELISKNM
jgi:hypothetical protein